MSTYLDLLDGVRNYYGSGSDEWVKIASGSMDPNILQQVPGVSIIRSRSGAYIGYDYANPFPSTYNPITDIDSNIQTGSYGVGTYTAQVPATAIDDGAGGLTMRSGALTGSAGSVLRTVADKVSLGLAGVAIGSKLGLAIDTALYNANPDWWDEHFPSLNPQTWEQLIPAGGVGDAVRTLIGFGQDGSATMYLDERIMAYGYLAMLKGGAWSDSTEEEVLEPSDKTGLDLEGLQFPVKVCPYGKYYGTYGSGYLYWELASSVDRAVLYYRPPGDGNTAYVGMVAASEGPFEGIEVTVTNQQGYIFDRYTEPSDQVTFNGRTFYYSSVSKWTYTSEFQKLAGIWNDYTENVSPSYQKGASLAWLLLYGDMQSGHPEGIDPNTEASTQIDPTLVINPTTGQAVTPNDDIGDVVEALRNAYPSLFADTTYQDVPQEDGTVSRITYVAVPYPTTDDESRPVTYQGVDPQTHPQIDPQSRPETAQSLTDSIIGPPEAPSTGSGETPPAIVPTGSASALYSIYNPTDSELSSFGGWLWSSSFVDQLLKLFSDPMQAIVGLHKVFAPPTISGRAPIKVGYLSSGVEANVVGAQYVSVPCGSVRVSEYFGNALDYDPFTRIQIYLPFIGIQPLDTGDVMRGTVTVTYHVDVLTGACLAEVSVARDGAGGILYTYAGNASVQYPISSGSYMGIMSSMISIAGGIAGTIASGGALAPVALGSASGLMSARTRVQHSGSFSGNAGAMGARVPYLIISRAQSAVASTYEEMEGAPSNYSTTLGACSGFVRCKTAHLEGIPATSDELEELERMLASGIIM